MAYRSDGSSHRDGIKNELNTAKILEVHSNELFGDSNITVSHLGGTQHKADLVVDKSDNKRIKVSVKRKKKITTGSFDYINTSKLPNSFTKVLDIYNKGYKFGMRDQDLIDELKLVITNELNDLDSDTLFNFLEESVINANKEKTMVINETEEETVDLEEPDSDTAEISSPETATPDLEPKDTSDTGGSSSPVSSSPLSGVTPKGLVNGEKKGGGSEEKKRKLPLQSASTAISRIKSVSKDLKGNGKKKNVNTVVVPIEVPKSTGSSTGSAGGTLETPAPVMSGNNSENQRLP